MLQHLSAVRDALSDDQRRAFDRLMMDRKLEPVTVDATAGHFLLRYTFGPDDRVERAKARDGRILRIVVPEKEDPSQWHTEIKTGAELIKVLQHREPDVRRTGCDWLIQRGAGGLDAGAKKAVAELILARVEAGDAAPDPGACMHAYSKVAQAGDRQRVKALVEKTSVHHVAGMFAAYAAVAPADAVSYAAKTKTDKHFSIRAIQGLAMAPDALRLLQSARGKMPDMAWKIDEEIKNLRAREQARAQGRPENPGQVELEARRQAQKEAAQRARAGKKPGDYHGFDDWFADLSSSDHQKLDKAGRHYINSVYAVDLSTLKPEQRAAVFKIAQAALTAPKTTMSRDDAGMILVFAADRSDAGALFAMIKPDNSRSHYPLAALMRADPERAEQALLAIEEQKFNSNPIRQAVLLVPAEAVLVLERTQQKLKHKNTGQWYSQLIAEAKQRAVSRE